jgi:hypothetical protein
MTAEVSTQRGGSDPARGAYERADVAPKAAWWTLAAVIGTVALVCLGVAGLFAVFGNLRQGTPAPPRATGAPMLQTREGADRAAIEARARARLGGREGGMPIDEAMRRTAAAGWDAAP